jgi:putative flippase GtrA
MNQSLPTRLGLLPTFTLQRILRGGAVGAVATVADAAALALLTENRVLAPQFAVLPAMGLGVAIQFLGSKYVTFAERSSQRMAAQSLQFTIVEALSLALGMLLYNLCLQLGAHYLLARILVGAIIYFGVSLPLWARIFQKPAGAGSAS